MLVCLRVLTCTAALGVAVVPPGPASRAAGDEVAERRASGGIDWAALARDWPRMGPLERAAWDRIFARQLGQADGVVDFHDPTGMRPDFPSEFCTTATLPGPSTDLPIVTQNTTVDRLDLHDLSASGACAGGGPQFTGTGLGAELVYKLRVDTPCNLVVTVRPDVQRPEWDVSLYVVGEPLGPDRPPPCEEPADGCVRASDSGGIGIAESIRFLATTDFDYYAIVDGYNGSAGVYEIEIVEDGSTGCKLTRMTLDEFLAGTP